MKRFLLPIFLFLAFMLESIFVSLFSIEKFGIDRFFTPRFLIVLMMMIAFFYDRNRAILYAGLFGLLYDIVYTDMLGVYMFFFPITIYIISYSMKFLHTNIFVVFFISLLGLTFLEGGIYSLYYLVNVTDLVWNEFVFNRLLPTLVINGVFIILIYYPMRNYLVALKKLASREVNKLV